MIQIHRFGTAAKIALPVLAALLMSLVFSPFSASAGGGTAITRTFQDGLASGSGTYSGTRDAWVDQNAPTTAEANTSPLNVSAQTNKANRALVSFDISSIPSGSSSVSGTLSLYLLTYNSASVPWDVHRFTAGFTEGVTTWNTMPAFNGTATASVTPNAAPSFTSWTVTTDVSAYVAGTATNYGWLVKYQTEGSNKLSTIASREYATAADRPKLAVTFTAPFDSYTDSGYGTISDSFSASGATVYMHGTTYANIQYKVGWYDGSNTGGSGGALVQTDTPTASGGIFNAQATPKNIVGAVAGTWHVLVQPANASSALPSTYNAAVASADTYQLLGNDSFSVTGNAIPEFPTIVGFASAIGVCCVAYIWMRRNGHNRKTLAN